MSGNVAHGLGDEIVLIVSCSEADLAVPILSRIFGASASCSYVLISAISDDILSLSVLLLVAFSVFSDTARAFINYNDDWFRGFSSHRIPVDVSSFSSRSR